ncbi:unnamed protein product [Blepharisma stoltei]|uniref:Phosphatidylinositol-specific phospholipase C X domain-containing protein n=1 Tax=Blepharisma stoltei TaxID=1481888 RepID=A0AAU9IK41_9CILI|nr:unnamed protein product [Blepharisma stoltei]
MEINFEFTSMEPTTSSWMEECIPYIKDKCLHEILIPGSHNSGTYRYSCCIAAPWVRNQSADFYEQLERGIRYFDCRLRYIPKDSYDPFKFSHESWVCDVCVLDLFESIENFLSLHNKEIIILDFSHFRKFTDSAYVELNLRFEKIKEMVITKDFLKNTIGENLKTNRRIVVLSSDARFGNGEYAKSINHYDEWPNTDRPEILKKFIQKQMCRETNRLRLFQCILSTQRIAHNLYLANYLRPYLEDWLENEWWDKVNIIFTDFSVNDKLVEIAIKANKSRGLQIC